MPQARKAEGTPIRKHPANAKKERSHCKSLSKRLLIVRFGTAIAAQQTLAAFEASFEVVYIIAPQKKKHNWRELSYTLHERWWKKVYGKDQAQKLQAISLSNNTIHRRIHDSAQNILDQLVHDVRHSPYGKCSPVWWVNGHFILCPVSGLHQVRSWGISEGKFLFCEQFKATTEGEDVLKPIDNILSWSFLGLCGASVNGWCTQHDG